MRERKHEHVKIVLKPDIQCKTVLFSPCPVYSPQGMCYREKEFISLLLISTQQCNLKEQLLEKWGSFKELVPYSRYVSFLLSCLQNTCCSCSMAMF